MSARVVRVLAAAIILSFSCAAERLHVTGLVTSVSGPNLEGVAIGDPLSAWFDYEIVTTPHPDWDPDTQTLEEAVETHASLKLPYGLEHYRNGARIWNAAAPAYWILHGFEVETPYGLWESIWQDYALFDFHDDLSLKGFGIGGSWFSMWVDESPDLGYFAMYSGALGSSGTYVQGSAMLAEEPGGFARFSLVAHDVPEPGTLLMVVGGLVVAGVVGRRIRTI